MAAQLRTSFTGQGFITSRMSAAPSATAPRQVTCMAKKKGVRMIVTLECTEARAAGATPSRYTTQKVGSPSSRTRQPRGTCPAA
jgi:ribosomal protein L33